MPKVRSAILLIDFQNDFTTEGGALHDRVKEVIDNTLMMKKVPELVAEARKQGTIIIHSPIVVDPDSVPGEGEMDDQVIASLREGNMFQKGTWGAEICESVKPEKSDFVLQQRATTSIWKGTVLKSLLEKQKVDVLILAGFLSNGCVLQAVQEAADILTSDIQLLVLSDGTAAYSNKEHLNTVQEVITSFADVATVDYAFDLIDGSSGSKALRRNSALGVSIFDPVRKLRLAMVDKWLPGERISRFLDNDGDGMVTYEEFHDFLLHFNLLSDEIDPRTIFNILDFEDDGEIPVGTVISALKARDDDVEEDPDADRVDVLNARNLKPFPSPYLVSLVAHNNMKPSMMKFVKDNITFFSRVKLVTTGSTGRALKSLGLDVAHLVASGPLGGDQEIGGLIAQGKVCAVFFFVDPLSAHPHAADIDALNRICCVHDVMFANNPSTATALVFSLENSPFGYSCLCGVNPTYINVDSGIVSDYKENQKKVIANVSTGDNAKPADKIPEKKESSKELPKRGAMQRTSSVHFLKKNDIPAFIKRDSGVSDSIRSRSSKGLDKSWASGLSGM